MNIFSDMLTDNLRNPLLLVRDYEYAEIFPNQLISRILSEFTLTTGLYTAIGQIKQGIQK